MSTVQLGKILEGQGKISFPKKYRSGGSCAECKRSKIKCTRGPQDSFPCESCLKRGCQSICPSGTLTAGNATNRALAKTEQLYDKITQLTTRVRELENALRELQAASSLDPHPLLCEELLTIKNPLQDEAIHPNEAPPSDHETLDALGSLSITGPERSNFHGQGAGAWFFLQNEDPDTEVGVDNDGESPLPTDILFASDTFPLGTLSDTKDDLRSRIQWFIPSRDIALRLVENYFNGMAWMYDPIPRVLFTNTVFDVVYTSHFPQVRTYNMNAVALLFLILAIGTLLDLDLPNYSPRATQYYQLARASLAIDMSLDDPSLGTVRALHLMGFFLHMSDMKSGFGTSWALMGLNAKLAIGIGLHRDSEKWKLGGEGEARRRVFWELYTYDTWQALPCGRPPSFHRLTIDNKMPYIQSLTSNVTLDDPGDDFKAWKYRFCYECLSTMMEQLLAPRTPPYATILLLDRRIHDDPIPPVLQLDSSSGCDNVSTPMIMQRYTVLCVREISLLLMHRPFFAHAVTEKAPLEAKFAPSVLAVYRSACSIIAGVRSLYDHQPKLAPRVWFFWAHVFSATICLGGLVARCPSLSLASSALAQVDSACELFGKVTNSNRVSKALPSMRKLREKAHHALGQFRAGQQPSSPTEGKRDDELSALVGETRLVSHHSVTQQLLSPTSSIRGETPPPDSGAQHPTTTYDYLQQPVDMQTYSAAAYQPHRPNTSVYGGSGYTIIPAEEDTAQYSRQYESQVYAGIPASTQIQQIPQEYSAFPWEYYAPMDAQYAMKHQPYEEQPQAFVQQQAWHEFMSQLEMESYS